MSWCTRTRATDVAIDQTWIQTLRHRPRLTIRGPRCRSCGQRWKRGLGCPRFLWAIDYLSRLSSVVYPTPPPRPSGRHRPSYVSWLAAGSRPSRTPMTMAD